MPNRRPFDPIGAFNFRLEIEGVTEGPVLAVDGLTARTDVVSYKDGSDIIVRHRPGRSRSDNIVVRRGYNPEQVKAYIAERDREWESKLAGTAEYIDKVLTRLTFWGAIYIAGVCLLPEFARMFYPSMPFSFGGTSLLILVVVTMDFMSQMQAHAMSHQYEGMMQKANLRNYGRGGQVR